MWVYRHCYIFRIPRYHICREAFRTEYLHIIVNFERDKKASPIVLLKAFSSRTADFIVRVPHSYPSLKNSLLLDNHGLTVFQKNSKVIIENTRKSRIHGIFFVDFRAFHFLYLSEFFLYRILMLF